MRSAAANWGDLVLDERAMLASAWGTPAQAFGSGFVAEVEGVVVHPFDDIA